MTEAQYIPREVSMDELDTDKPLDVMSFTQKMRYRAVKEITCNGASIPSDIGDLRCLLNDMDISALSKHKVETTIGPGEIPLSMIMAQVERMFGKDPYRVDNPTVKRSTPPAIELPNVALNPGEGDQGEVFLNPSDFLPDDTRDN